MQAFLCYTSLLRSVMTFPNWDFPYGIFISGKIKTIPKPFRLFHTSTPELQPTRSVWPSSCLKELHHPTREGERYNATKMQACYWKWKYPDKYSQGSVCAQSIRPACTVHLPRTCNEWIAKCKLKSILSAFVKQDLNIADKTFFIKNSPCCDYRSPHSKH